MATSVIFLGIGSGDHHLTIAVKLDVELPDVDSQRIAKLVSARQSGP